MQKQIKWFVDLFSNDRTFNYKLVVQIFIFQNILNLQFGLHQSSIAEYIGMLSVETITNFLIIFLYKKRSQRLISKPKILENFAWLLILSLANAFVSIQIQMVLTGNLIQDLTTQLITTIMLFFFIFMFYSQIMLTSANYFEQKKYLENIEPRIKELKERAELQLDNQLKQMRSETKTFFQKSFDEISASASGNQEISHIEQLVNQFQNEKIRPLSLKLSRELSELKKSTPDASKINPFTLPPSFKFSNAYNLWVLGSLSIIFLFGQLVVLGGEAVKAGFIYASLELLFLALIKSNTKKLIIQTKLGLLIATLSSFIASFICTYLVASFGLYEYLNNNFWQSYWINVQLSPVVYFGIAYSGVVRENLTGLVKSTENLQLELKHEEEKLSQNIAVIQKRWSYFLHGTVQSALIAALTRLQLGYHSQEAWKNFVKNLAEIENSINSYKEEDLDIQTVISDLQEIWQGVIEIEFNKSFTDGNISKLNQNTIFALREIWRECVSNAVRHGLANKVNISLVVTDTDLRTVIANNGISPDPKMRPSLGSSLLDDLTVEWWIEAPPNKSKMVEIHCKLVNA